MQVSEFKNAAWQSKERAAGYHTATAAAPRILELLRHDLFLRYVRRYASPGAKILDVGCGTGLLAAPLYDDGYRVVACDTSQAMLDRAAVHFGSRDIELRLGSAFDLPAEDAEFDMVISRMVMPHFPDWIGILREKARVTRADGNVFFDFGNREHLLSAAQSPGHYPEFPYGNDVDTPENFYAVASEDDMKTAAADCGLRVLSIVPHGLLLNNMHLWKAVGRQGIDEFNAKLEELLQDEKARELVLLVEESFMPHMPKQMAYGSLIVLRRDAD